MISKEEFKELYIDKKMTLGEIAKKYRVCHTTSMYWRKKYEIPIQQHSNDKRGGQYQSVLQRCWQQIEIEGECWIFKGCVDGKGYPMMSIRGKNQLIHREIYRQFNGKISEDMCICHFCDTPRCINPAHLFIGTQKDNIQDCIKKGRFKGIDNLRRSTTCRDTKE